jgi:hypothetical protein
VIEVVFGYASLVTRARAARLASLRGVRRVWGVAMDNRVAVPGYKVYESPDGRRPAVAVAFLDVEPAPGLAITGTLLEVDQAELRALDRRERQYRRVDVTAAIDAGALPSEDARVWTYVGRPDGRERVRRGRAGHVPVVIQRAYLDRVRGAFRALGPGHAARFAVSTEPPPFPVRELARVDLPR